MLNDFNRRNFLSLSVLGSVALSMKGMPALAQSSPHVGRNHFPRMMQEHLTNRVARINREIHSRIFSLQSKTDALNYIQNVQSKIQQSFGPFPEKSPLKARTTKVLEREGYHIENVIFESRPGFLVTANLYVPTNKPYPLPGVVGTCGHSSNGKAYDGYQAFAQGLAKQGYVVLLYDPISQGERLQYVDDNLGSKIGVGVREHLYAGNQQFLVSEFIGTWRAWDGIRALDYLLSREEVDPNHIGVTGNSGGGTMTTWLCGVEDRWSMAAPSCFVTTFLHNVENELPADTEQCPPRALALGLDHADFLAAMAPKPVIILAKEKDYFDVRGSIEAYNRLKHLYQLLGAEDNIGLFIGPTYHGYSQENREAMYQWFNRATQISDLETEPDISYEAEEDLWCTPNGQVSELDSKTVFTFTAEKANVLQSNREKLSHEDLKKEINHFVKKELIQSQPDYRILRAFSNSEYPRRHVTPYVVATDPGIHALVYRFSEENHYSRLPKAKGKGPAILYVSHLSADLELRNNDMLQKALENDPTTPLFSCDLRGIGESAPNTCGQDLLNPYGPDYFYAIHGVMLDDPYPAQRTRDLLTVLLWLKLHGYDQVHLMAQGWGTIPALLGSVMGDTVEQVSLKGALTSYHELAQTEYYEWPLSSMLPNVLEKFDLSDCIDYLGDRVHLISS